MKKILLAIFALALVSSPCFAQQTTAPAAKTFPAPAVVKIFTGKVDSVSIGDATKGTRSGIVVLDEKGQKINFVVKSGTPIIAKDGKALVLSEIKKDNKVTVEYTTGKTGTHKAQSIKLVE